MALRSDWSGEMCPIQRSLDVVGDPWVLIIIRDALHGRGRFDELRDNLGISEAVLSRRLHDMVEADLLERVEYRSPSRPRHAYAATSKAAELLPVLQQLAIWGERHTTTPKGGGHMALIHERCGQETTRGESCSHCHEELHPEHMSWAKPWRNARDRLQPPGALAAAVGKGR